MSLSIKSHRTRWGVLLLGIPDHRGTLFFPASESRLPGLHFEIMAHIPLADQLRAAVLRELKEDLPWNELEIEPEFCEAVTGQDHSLYVGYLRTRRQVIPASWKTLPELLRAMPRNRTRLACLKAWQILSGVHKENIRAVESLPDNQGEMLHQTTR